MPTETGRSLRIQILIGFMCVAMVVYFLLLGRIAWAFITSGSGAAIGLGLAILVMPLIGTWVMVSTLATAAVRGRSCERLSNYRSQSDDQETVGRSPHAVAAHARDVRGGGVGC